MFIRMDSHLGMGSNVGLHRVRCLGTRDPKAMTRVPRHRTLWRPTLDPIPRWLSILMNIQDGLGIWVRMDSHLGMGSNVGLHRVRCLGTRDPKAMTSFVGCSKGLSFYKPVITASHLVLCFLTSLLPPASFFSSFCTSSEWTAISEWGLTWASIESGVSARGIPRP
jgi:hypothetical protein